MKISLDKFQKTGGWTPGSYVTRKEAYLEPGALLSYPIGPVVAGDYVIVKAIGERMPPTFIVFSPNLMARFGWTSTIETSPVVSTGIFPDIGLAIPVEKFPDYYRIDVYKLALDGVIILYAQGNEPPRLYSDAVYFNLMPSLLQPLVALGIVGAFGLGAVVLSRRKRRGR